MHFVQVLLVDTLYRVCHVKRRLNSQDQRNGTLKLDVWVRYCSLVIGNLFSQICHFGVPLLHPVKDKLLIKLMHLVSV